ncbi:hypothetical protein G7Y89_g7696 [Cudoniella acicularis]|uniref:Uncharacterized protein n=1 Tax=Cudoniella acicularis TaxID=354080 RepID=A0A8H4RLJ8_9HELO|nr:hypothetical protein G7Y89_g7696 [Cudoniella acicularis]
MNPRGIKKKASGEVRTEGLSASPKRPAFQQSFNFMSQPREEIGDQIGNRRTLQESELPDTLQWSRFIHSGSPEGLPAIPSQCLLPSDNGSGTSGSQAYYRPFGGAGLATLNHISKPGARERPTPRSGRPLAENSRALQIYNDSNGNECLQSLTEVATPIASQNGDAEFGKNIASVQEALEKFVEGKAQASDVSQRALKQGSDSQVMIKQSNSHPRTDSHTMTSDSDEKLVPRLRNIVDHIAHFPNTVRNHERRLDSLENGSFANPAVEDLQEGHNNLDLRISELEDRVGDVENAQAAQVETSSIGSQHVGDSFDSKVSTTSSAMIGAAMDQVDSSRIEALEAQVAELQAIAPPSHTRPWEVEVVFLPFGSNLMGLWSSQFSAAQRSRDSTVTDDWTQTQNNFLVAAQAYLTAHDQTSAWETSASDLAAENDSSWLVARAADVEAKWMSDFEVEDW